MPKSRGRGRRGVPNRDRVAARNRKAGERRAAGQREAERSQPDERERARDETGNPQRVLASPAGGYEHMVIQRARRSAGNRLLVLDGRHLHSSW
jgi:hypothetical protein